MKNKKMSSTINCKKISIFISCIVFFIIAFTLIVFVTSYLVISKTKDNKNVIMMVKTLKKISLKLGL